MPPGFLESTKCLETVLLNFQKTSPDLSLYYSISERDGVGNELWEHLIISIRKRERSEKRFQKTYSELLSDHDAVILLGGDLPHIDTAQLEKALSLIREGSDVIGPAADGGFYLFGSSKKISNDVWESITYSSDQTYNEILEKFSFLCDFEILEKSFDIDEYEDLLKLSYYKNANLTPGQGRIYKKFEILYN